MSLFEEVGKAYEGFKDEVYLDHEKIPSIGGINSIPLPILYGLLPEEIAIVEGMSLSF